MSEGPNERVLCGCRFLYSVQIDSFDGEERERESERERWGSLDKRVDESKQSWSSSSSLLFRPLTLAHTAESMCMYYQHLHSTTTVDFRSSKVDGFSRGKKFAKSRFFTESKPCVLKSTEKQVIC